MQKKWNKTGEGKYSFYADNIVSGKMELSFKSFESVATFEIGNDKFLIKKTGFWKNTMEVVDKMGQVVAKVYADKWYSDKLTLEYNGKKYQLVIRNNPLAEWAILFNNQNVLAYGLHAEDGAVNIKITTSTNSTDFLPDFLLWYLFVPVAAENMGDDFTFLMLLTNQ